MMLEIIRSRRLVWQLDICLQFAWAYPGRRDESEGFTDTNASRHTKYDDWCWVWRDTCHHAREDDDDLPYYRRAFPAL